MNGVEGRDDGVLPIPSTHADVGGANPQACAGHERIDDLVPYTRDVEQWVFNVASSERTGALREKRTPPCSVSVAVTEALTIQKSCCMAGASGR